MNNEPFFVNDQRRGTIAVTTSLHDNRSKTGIIIIIIIINIICFVNPNARQSRRHSGLERLRRMMTRTTTTRRLPQLQHSKTATMAKRTKIIGGTSSTNDDGGKKKAIMHSFATSSTRGMSHAERATSTAQHLPEALLRGGGSSAGVAGPKDDTDGSDASDKQTRGDDGIFRGNQARNKFWAGPIRAAAHVRVTARFDYQPDICKDYKDTGFCGFGDTCIYLHDRGDTLAGWQIDQQYEAEQQRKKEAQELEMQNFLDNAAKTGKPGSGDGSDGIAIESDDGLPFACFLCREYFKDPVVTTCQHYFCQDCILDHIRNNNNNNNNGSGSSAAVATFCPICNKDTHGVFHQPTKLLAKKRKALGSSNAAAAKAENSWEAFYKLYSTTS
jgi:RING finger protein 113A